MWKSEQQQGFDAVFLGEYASIIHGDWVGVLYCVQPSTVATCRSDVDVMRCETRCGRLAAFHPNLLAIHFVEFYMSHVF